MKKYMVELKIARVNPSSSIIKKNRGRSVFK